MVASLETCQFSQPSDPDATDFLKMLTLYGVQLINEAWRTYDEVRMSSVRLCI